MKIHRIEHVGVIVNDLSAAKAFFLDFGLELQGEGEVEGEWVDRIVGLKDVKATSVMLQAPDGQANIELVKFYRPSDENDIQQPAANTLGIRHIAFAVDDIEAVVAKLKKKGTELVGEIQTYEDSYKLCYVRGPEGCNVHLIIWSAGQRISGQLGHKVALGSVFKTALSRVKDIHALCVENAFENTP